MRRRNWVALIVAGVGLSLVVALFSPLASGNPDGLERVAEDEAFIDKAEDPGYEIIPDYTFPGVENETLATILSGIVGVLLMAGIGLAVGYAMRASQRSRAQGDKDTTATAQGAGGD